MTKRYSKLNLKALLLFLMVATVVFAGFISCESGSQRPSGQWSEAVNDGDTGPIGGDGEVVTITNYITNYVTNNRYIQKFVTNKEYHPDKIIWTTNVITITNLGNLYTTNEYVYVDKIITNTVVITNLTADPRYYVSKYHNSMMYRVYAPFSGIGKEGDYKYTNLSYLDTKTLTETWRKVIKMESTKGYEFTIRNRDTRTYFYFDDNLDIRWSWKPDKVIKKFVQGIIIKHICGNDTKGHYAIAGLYKLTDTSADLRAWGQNDGVNLLQGRNFRENRRVGEYDIIVLNPGHVVNGSEYGLEIYNSTAVDELRFSIGGVGYKGGNGYFEERPEVYMSKITHVTELWKNWRPWELYDLAFQKTKR